MVLVVHSLDVISVGDVLLLMLARHGSGWAVHHPVQMVEEFASLLCRELRAWLMQEGAWDLEVFSEDQLSTGGV